MRAIKCFSCLSILLAASTASAQGFFGPPVPPLCTFAAGPLRISIAGDDTRICGPRSHGQIASITDATSGDCGDVPGATGGGSIAMFIQWDDSLGGSGEWRCIEGGGSGPGSDSTAIHDNVASEISAIARKATPVGGDLLLIEDSEAANVKKRIPISSLPGGGSSNSFETQTTPLGSSIVADSPTDTLTWTAGTGVLITGTGASDTIDISLDPDLEDLADGSLTGSKVGTGIAAGNITTGTIPAARVGASHIDLLTEIAAGLKSGLDATLITGTATTGECAEFDVNGDIIGAGAACGSGGADQLGSDLDRGDVIISGTGTIATLDWAAFADLSAGGVVDDDSHAHLITNVDAFTEVQLQTQLSDVTDVFTNNDGTLADDNLGDDLITALSGVTTVTNGSWCQGDAASAMNCDVVATDFNSAGLVNASHAGSAHHADEVTATESVQGVIEIATQVETDAGTGTDLAVTANKLEAWDGGATGSITKLGAQSQDLDMNSNDLLNVLSVDLDAPLGSGVASDTWKEGVADGIETLVISGPSGGFASNRTCTLEDDNTPYDGCVTAGGVTELNDVGDVVVTTPADGQFIVRDQTTDTDWENVALSGDVSSVSVAGAVVIAASHSGSAHHTRSHALDGVSDHTGTLPDADLEDILANTIVLRNAGTTGVRADVKISGLTEEVAPTALDWVLGEDAAGNLRKYDVGNLPTGGGGEANTHSSEAGGLSIAAVVPKVGIDLRLKALAAADFNLTGDVIDIDDATWAKDSELHTQSHALDSGTDHTGTLPDADLETMLAWTLSMNNSASTAARADVKISSLSDEPTPAALDWLMIERADGTLARADIGDLPGGGGGDDITVENGFTNVVDPRFSDSATIDVTGADAAPDTVVMTVNADSINATHLDETANYSFTGDIVAHGEWNIGTVSTLANSPTPSIVGSAMWTAPVTGQTITNFTRGTEGTTFQYRQDAASLSTIDCTASSINCGTTDLALALGDRLTFRRNSVNWDVTDYIHQDFNNNVDDDVPEAGDFAAGTDFDLNGALNTGSVDKNELAANAAGDDEIDWGELADIAVGGQVTIAGADVASGTIPQLRVGDDHILQIAEIDAAIKRGPDATDTHLLTTDVVAPGALTCLQMDTDGSVVLAGAACGAGGAVATDAIWDAKGDLALGTGIDTAAKLTVGANDTMLMADSTPAQGAKWATPATVRAALSLVPGTDVQIEDAELTLIAGLAETTGNVVIAVAGAWASVAQPAIDCTNCTSIPAGSHTGTIVWSGTSIQETGLNHQFGDATDATLTHTYGLSGATDPVIVYSNDNVDVSTPHSATSYAADASDTGEFRLTTATLGAEVSMGITEAAGPDGIMGLNVDVAGVLTKFMELHGGTEDITALKPFIVDDQLNFGSTVGTLGASATPSISGDVMFITNAAAQTITDFTGDALGGYIIIHENKASLQSTLDCTGATLDCGSDDILMGEDDVATFVQTETGRWFMTGYLDGNQNMGPHAVGATQVAFIPATGGVLTGDAGLTYDPATDVLTSAGGFNSGDNDGSNAVFLEQNTAFACSGLTAGQMQIYMDDGFGAEKLVSCDTNSEEREVARFETDGALVVGATQISDATLSVVSAVDEVTLALQMAAASTLNPIELSDSTGLLKLWVTKGGRVSANGDFFTVMQDSVGANVEAARFRNIGTCDNDISDANGPDCDATIGNIVDGTIIDRIRMDSTLAQMTFSAGLGASTTTTANYRFSDGDRTQYITLVVPDEPTATLTFPNTTGTFELTGHTIESHAATSATGANLETLTNAGDADALHTHDLKAPLASPTFTGTVTVPTPFTMGLSR